MEPANIFVMPGSQFSAKIVIALTSREIPHYCSFVHPMPSKRKLPSGGRLVPEAVIGEAVVPDSDEIMRHYDVHHGTEFFADDAARQLTTRISEGIVAGSVLYYGWVFVPSYQRSMRQTFESMLPSYVCMGRGALIDCMTSGLRANFRRKAQQQLGVDDAALDDEPAIRAKLIDELVSVQALLATPEQPHLLATSRPCAADVSLYAMLERLVGDMGDIKLSNALPELATEPQLARLMAWHQRMREQYPIKFKGKRPPKGASTSSAKVGAA